MSNSAGQHKKIVTRLSLVVVGMFGFGFALVPLYSLICDAFGLNGRFLEIQDGTYTSEKGNAQAAKFIDKVDKSRTITVQFTATLNQNMAWDFKPMVNSIKVHPGEVKVVKFYAKNKTGNTVVAQAVPSLVPGKAVKYFTKMECFCFTQQTFKPEEARQMPLQFVVTPDLPESINTITLAYTFFDTNGKTGSNSAVNRKSSSQYAGVTPQISVKHN